MTTIPKSKPFRSPAFIHFCHEHMKPAPCCLCGVRPWVALHHFGDDGGWALKPSDNEVARVCVECHMRYDLKRRGLSRSKLEILEAYQNDALKLNRAYLEYLEVEKRGALPLSRCDGCDYLDEDGKCRAKRSHCEPPAACALDELNLWLVTECTGLAPDEQREWLLSWANRRSANVIGFLAEPMREIARVTIAQGNHRDVCLSMRYTAEQALKTAHLED